MLYVPAWWIFYEKLMFEEIQFTPTNKLESGCAKKYKIEACFWGFEFFPHLFSILTIWTNFIKLCYNDMANGAFF